MDSSIMTPKNFLWAFLAVVLLSVLPGCKNSESNLPAAPVETAEPTPAPPGSKANPYQLIIINPAVDESEIDAAAYLAEKFEEESGYTLKILFAASAQEALLFLAKHQAEGAFLPPATYIYAHDRNLAEFLLIPKIYGTYTYGSQLFINKNAYSEVPIPADPLDEIESLTSLSFFAGKKPCFTTPTSLSGYVLPTAVQRRIGLNLDAPIFTQSFEAVIRSLYIKGICDLGAGYAYSGDPRTAVNLQDLPDVFEVIQPIWKSPPIIPYQVFSTRPGTNREFREELANFFLSWVATSDGKANLAVLTGYQIQDFRRADDSVIDPLRQAIQDSAVPITDLIGY